MAAEAKFMEDGKHKLAARALKAGCADMASCATCVSCGNPGAPCIISRQCGSHCEGPTCSCIGVRWCISCILQHYWHDTNSELKSFARCPTCRAEFCMTDIQLQTVVDAHMGDLSPSSSTTVE